MVSHFFFTRVSGYSWLTSSGVRWIDRYSASPKVCATILIFPPLHHSHFHFNLHYLIMLRVSLSQISNNRVRKTELISYQREIIVKAHVIDISFGRIHKLTNLSDFTIRIILKKVVERDDDEIKSRSDRSVILSERDERHLIRIARINSRISYKNLKDQIDLTCSRTIIYRALKNYELVNWLTAKRLLLTLEMIRKRYEWCLIHKDWTYEHWFRMIFSDECSVEKGSEKDRQWVFRLSHQKFEKKKWYSRISKAKRSVSWFGLLFEKLNGRICINCSKISNSRRKTISQIHIWLSWTTICLKFGNQISYSCKTMLSFIQSKRWRNNSMIMT